MLDFLAEFGALVTHFRFRICAQLAVNGGSCLTTPKRLICSSNDVSFHVRPQPDMVLQIGPSTDSIQATRVKTGQRQGLDATIARSGRGIGSGTGPSVAQKPLRSLLDIRPERSFPLGVLGAQRGYPRGKNIMVGRSYFKRQAATLLRFAKSTSDPQTVAALVKKADELRSQVDETAPSPDLSPRAPDVEPENRA